MREGEWYYSVVFEQDDDYVRRDYSAESWTGLPDGAVGCWKNRMPLATERKLVLAPNEVLVDMLRQMEAIPGKAKSRFLLALMLLRKKVVRSCSASESPSSSEVMSLEVLADGSRIDVAVCEIRGDEQETLREELQELLYCESEPDE